MNKSARYCAELRFLAQLVVWHFFPLAMYVGYISLGSSHDVSSLIFRWKHYFTWVKGFFLSLFLLLKLHLTVLSTACALLHPSLFICVQLFLIKLQLWVFFN